MKAALFEKPGSLRVVNKDLRRLAVDELLVKIQACGVCGTDVHIIEGTSRSTPPVVLGHEFSGIVEDRGEGPNGIPVGALVAVDPNIACGTCFYCRRGLVHLCENLRALGVDIDGGMAQYCIVPSRQAYTLPADMPAEVSAFIEPVSCVVHGVDRAQIRPGDTVAILGGGTIGLLMLQLAKSAGASRIIVTEPLEAKRRIAENLGADYVFDPGTTDVESAVRDLTGVGADVVVECVGLADTMKLALTLARRGGVVEFFGVSPLGKTIPVEPNLVYFKELTIVGSYVNPNTFSRAIALLSGRKVTVDGFMINRFPIDGVHEAIAYQKEGRTLKSIVQPNA